MTLLNRMTIRTRMILSFALVLLFFTFFGAIVFNQMKTLGQLTATLYDHPLQVSNAALKAKSGVISMHRAMKDVSTSKTELAITMAIQQVQMTEKQVYDELEIIRTNILGQEGKDLVAETVAMFAGWKPIRVEVEELVFQGKQEAANRITREKGAQYVARLERQMSALTAYAINKADGFMAEAREVEATIQRNALFFIAALILVSLAVGFLMSASILSSISALKETMTRITRTGELVNAELTGKNEITEMAAHFNGVIQRLRGQFWLGQGQNMLNRELSGQKSYDQLMEIAIRHICRYTDACAGALYIFDPDTSVCELRASYALVERKHLANRFELGEGIVGQVAREKKAILLTRVAPEEAVAQSGTLSETAAAIHALPLLYENSLYGVLDIAVLTPFTPIQKEFLSSAAGILTVHLHTAAQNDRIKQLFENTQDANEKLKVQTTELQAQTEELRTLNEEFQQQSQELLAQNRELEAQRRQVEEANRLKSEFLSNMSHELRTPLNSVNALSRVLILQASDKLSSEEAGYLEIIERNGKHLLSLINDILDLSKIEAGRMDIDLARFSVATAIRTIVESIAPLAREKAIEIRLDIAPDLPRIESDESRVFQILQNIIANAVKFTEQGRVDISAQTDGNLMTVRVKDTGIGISGSDLAGIFEEFRQVDGATTRKFEGTGLGLAIAYKAARMLGGDIQVESQKDRGSEFTVYLPLRFQGPAPPTPLTGNAEPSRTGSLPDAGRDGKTILVVDDDPGILEMITAAFHLEGFRTITASNGKEALELAKAHHPFAITLDVVMPEMDGWEVLEKMKQDPEMADIPVIIVSVSDDRATGLALGAVGYVTKPVTREALISEINGIYGTLPASVMVVDDSAPDRDHAARMIRSEGMNALVAEDGSDCLSQLASTLPDVLVLDLVMPDLDGFQVLERIRKTPETEHLPVIIVTAKDLTLAEKQLLERNASAILTKGTRGTCSVVEEIKQILHRLGKGKPTPDPTPKRVLVVEDNDAAVIQVKNTLESLGIIVDVARDGQEAVARLDVFTPDGIVLDLMMPHMDGFELLEKLRGTPDTRNLPVLVLTAKDLTRTDREKLSNNNVRQLIQKGDVDRACLLNSVSDMLGLATDSPSNPDAAPSPDPVPEQPSAPLRKPLPGTGGDVIPLVLVVEDNPDNLTTIRAIIGDRYRIRFARDGEEGLEMTVDLIPDLVLLDMSLPKMDGRTLARTLKSREETRAIPLIALTAQAMKGDREQILESGCDDYIAKPVEPETLLATVRSWVSPREGT